MDFKLFVQEVPKVELHIHLEAVAELRTLVSLNEKYGMIGHLKTEADFRKYIFVHNLKEMIDKFFSFQELYREVEDYKLLMKDVLSYALANKIEYMEAFISPSMVKRIGSISIEDFYTVIIDEIKKIKKEHGVEIQLIIDLSRSFGPENAQDNLETARRYIAAHNDSPIIGFGLGGNEGDNPAVLYKDVFAEAARTGLHLVAHAGEEVDTVSIRQCIDDLGVERIGHGTSAIYDEDMMKVLRDRKIPLEVCVTSNVVTRKYVKSYDKHPIGKFIDNGILVTINTDDPVLFNVSLNSEIIKVYEHCGLSVENMKSLLRNNVYCSFMDDRRKDDFWNKKVLPVINKYFD